MKKILFGGLLILSATIIGCSKSDSSPTSSNSASINGVVKNANTQQAIAGVKVTVSPSNVTATTDNSGNYTISNVAEGTYTVTIYDAGYQKQTTANVSVKSNNATTVNGSIKPIYWSKNTSDNSANIVIPNTVSLTINGVALSSNDLIGCFYDSLGTTACTGYSPYVNSTATALTVWGDDATTSDKKEGPAVNESITWKVKRASDGKVFDATVVYSSGPGVYTVNGLSVVKTLSITAQ